MNKFGLIKIVKSFVITYVNNYAHYTIYTWHENIIVYLIL